MVLKEIALRDPSLLDAFSGKALNIVIIVLKETKMLEFLLQAHRLLSVVSTSDRRYCIIMPACSL